MFDQLWEESSIIQKMREESLMKGVQKGRQEEIQKEIQRLQQVLATIVRAKYPDLVDLAQQQTSHFDNPDTFLFLIEHVASAPNSESVRRLFEQQTM